MRCTLLCTAALMKVLAVFNKKLYRHIESDMDLVVA
jgi:hypothetical protein